MRRAAYFAASGIFVLAAIVIATMPSPQGDRDAVADSRGARADLREGVRFLRSRSILLGALVVTVILNTVFLPHASFVAVIGKDVLEASPLGVGTLTASEGVGSVVGSLWVAARAKESNYTRIYFGGAVLFALGVLAFLPVRDLRAVGVDLVRRGDGDRGLRGRCKRRSSPRRCRRGCGAACWGRLR